MSQADRLRQMQRHDRLRELMTAKVEKMVNKGSSRTKLAEKEREFVSTEIDLLIHSGDARESSLERIAASLRMFIEPRKTQSAMETKPSSSLTAKNLEAVGGKGPAAPAAAASEVKKTTASQKKPAVPAETSEEEPVNEHRRLIVPPSVLHADNVWAELCQRDVDDYNCSLAAQRRVLKKKEEEQREYLEAQVERRKQMRVAAHEEELRQAKLEEDQRKVFEAEEVKKKEKVKEKLAAEKKMRDEQLTLAHERKAREERSKKSENEQQVRQVQEECVKEEERQKAKLVKQKAEVIKFQEINKTFEEMKLQAKQKEAEYDKLQQMQYLEKLAKQERDRDEALVKLFEKQQKQGQIASEMAASVAVKAAEDERKALEYTARKEAEHLRAVKRKQEKEEADKMKVKQTLALQILEKEHAKLVQRDELQLQRQEIMKGVQEAQVQERQRVLTEKQKKDRQRALLQDQIDARLQQKVVFMSEEERKLNAKLIEKVKSPPRMH